MALKAAWLSPRGNNFTVVRLILSLLVIYSHCFQVTTGNYDIDAASPYIGAPISSFAVDGFFFLSGFLVYPSLTRLGGPLKFLAARLARLWPGLACSLALTVLFGALFSTAQGADYLKGPTLSFMFENLTFLKESYNLTGVGCGDVLCNVNGSLWTLPWEARCYLILAGLALAGLASPRAMTYVAYPVTLFFTIVWDVPAVRDLAADHLRPGVIYVIDMSHRLWPLFCLGTAAYAFRQRITLKWYWLVACLTVCLLTQHTAVALQSRAIFLGYAVLYFGLRTADWRKISSEWDDYSYGMYIYAFPCMMVILKLAPNQNDLAVAVESALLAAPFAVFSWRFVERPSLDLFRKHFRGKRAPAGELDTIIAQPRPSTP